MILTRRKTIITTASALLAAQKPLLGAPAICGLSNRLPPAANQIFPSNPSCFTIPNGLVGYWGFDPDCLDFNQGLAFDLSSGGYTGTLNGTTKPSLAGGQVGSALSFNGAANSNLNQVNTTYSNPTSSGSICWWQHNNIAFNNNTKSVATWGVQTSGNTTPEFDFQKFTDGKIYAGWNGPSDHRVTVASTAANWPQNTWVQYALVWVNGGNTILYVNGGILTYTQSGCVTQSISDTFTIGNLGRLYSNPSDINFSGSLDDIRIYNRALDPWEVLTLYRAGLAGIR